MSKREYCMKNPTVAYYSGLNGIEIKGAEWEDGEVYMYCVSGAWGGGKAFHRCRVYYPSDYPNEKSAFFRVHGHKIPLDECIRTGV